MPPSLGAVKVGVVAFDGTKVSANASMAASRTYQQIATTTTC
jgi:hypothetical protein